MLRPVSTLLEFKQMVSRASTVILVAGILNLAFAPLFDDRTLGLISGAVAVAMSLAVKRALASYNANPARSLAMIEANFYGLCALTLAGSIYHLVIEPPLRSILGLGLVGFGSAIGVFVVLAVRENLRFARSLLSDEQV